MCLSFEADTYSLGVYCADSLEALVRYTALEGCSFKGAMATTRQGGGDSKISIGSAQPLLKDNQQSVSQAPPERPSSVTGGYGAAGTESYICVCGRKAIAPTSDSFVRPCFLFPCRCSFLPFLPYIHSTKRCIK